MLDVRMLDVWMLDVHDSARITTTAHEATEDVGISFLHTTKSEVGVSLSASPIECLRALIHEKFIKKFSVKNSSALPPQIESL